MSSDKRYTDARPPVDAASLFLRELEWLNVSPLEKHSTASTGFLPSPEGFPVAWIVPAQLFYLHG